MRQQIQKFGRALSGMVMPNIGAFIAWGFVTALFIPSGWWPNTQMARLVDPMLTYLLPLLIAYTAGRNVAGERGGVIGAIAAMGVIVGSDIPMFIGVMVMGPLGGYTIRWFDKLTQGRIKAGFEMLVSNFSIGILGMLLAILGYWVIGGAVTGLTLLVSNGVEVVIRHGLLPLVSLLVEPSKVLFLNNALNHGIFSPIGIEQARETGQSIMFLLETNPGPGLGVLLACWFFGRGNMRQSAPGAVIIQFFGGIHEIYFPYILARPALILAPVAGSAAGLLFFSLAGAGLVAPASPGSIISVLAMAPKGQTLVVLAGVLISTAVSLLMAAPFVRRAAAAEDMPTGAIPAAQSGAPAVKAALHFPAHIRKVVFACDAGMGSSALGATRFRKRLSDAGIGTAVGNCAADGIPADADVEATVDAYKAKGTPVYGITLGDIVFDTPDLWSNMKESMANRNLPVFQTIGNHDHLQTETSDDNAAANFETQFGPRNYSFNRGDVHIVSMDNVLYEGKKKYKGGITDRQLEWLRQDLSHVDKDKLVIFCAHIPFRGGTSVTDESHENYDGVLDLLAEFSEAHIMIGHTHYQQKYIHKRNGKTILEHVHGAACGAWWTANLCADGTPNGYGVYEISGNTIANQYYKSTNKEADYQIRAYSATQVFGKSGSLTFGWAANAPAMNDAKCIVANVWNSDASGNWKVSLWQNGTKVCDMTRVKTYDYWAYAYHVLYYSKSVGTTWGKNLDHYYYGNLASGTPGAADFEIVAEDGMGNTYRTSKLQTDFTGF